MPMDERFRRLVREAVGGRRQREVAVLTGISLPYVNQLLGGKVPSREILVKLANGLSLSDGIRSRLFSAAGYVDECRPGEGGLPELPPHVADLVEELTRLSDTDFAIAESVVKRLAGRVKAALGYGASSA